MAHLSLSNWHKHKKKSTVGFHRMAPKLGLELEGLKSSTEFKLSRILSKNFGTRNGKKNVDRQSMTFSLSDQSKYLTRNLSPEFLFHLTLSQI